MPHCRTCGESKPDTDFYRWKSGQLRPDCKRCVNKATRRWQAANPVAFQRSQRKSRLKPYGISTVDYRRMGENQGWRCAICGTDDPGNGNGGRRTSWAVDHDHQTGAVRALLCNNCNTGLGQFLHDPVLLEIAIEYLRSSQDQRSIRPLFA